MATFSLAALKNTFDEVRVSVYAKNDTEKKVFLINLVALLHCSQNNVLYDFRYTKLFPPKIGVHRQRY